LSVVSINQIKDPALDKYDTIDQVLIPSQSFLRNFNPTTDYVECHVYTQDDILLDSNYNVTEYTLPDTGYNTSNQILFDPGTYLTSRNYNVGDFKLDYRIYRHQIYNLSSYTFFITEISTDRTEIRLSSNIVSNLTLETNTLNFINQVQSSPYFKDFLLNFGNNNAVNAVNIAIDESTNPYSLLIKLYQPLPTEFGLKAPLWIVEELASPIVFEVVLTPDFTPAPTPMIASANFDIDVHAQSGLASAYVNQSTIFNTPTLQDYQAIINQLNNDSIGINVDYTDYKNFVHFSSAAQRLVNFVYKLTEIQQNESTVSRLLSLPGMDVSVSGSAQSIQASTNNIIKNFDPYESFLYYDQSPYAWPKSGSVLYSVTSPQAQAFLGDNQTYGQLYSASLYDLENQDNLVFSTPGFIVDDPKNAQFLLFTNMLGQHYDSIWVYIKAINDIHKADNNMNTGISKDMVYDVLRSYGMKLYNNNSDLNLSEYLIGAPTGSYTVTGSGILTSGQDQSKELYKRLYHNLPYLLKSKGTTRGIQNLITVYGIPDTILTPVQYGGADSTSTKPDYVYDRFSYSLSNASGSYVKAYWAPLTQNYLKYGVNDLVPNSIEFRIKPDKHTKPSNVSLIEVYQSGSSKVNFGVELNYIVSQSVPSANFTLIISGSSGYVSSSLSVPMYATGSDGDTGFWNVLLTTDTKYKDYISSISGSQKYTLTVQNCISGRVGHTAKTSIGNYNNINYRLASDLTLNRAWSYYGNTSSLVYLSVGGPGVVTPLFSSSFIGGIQELRYWSEPLSSTAFDAHTLSNESFQGNNINGAYNDLAARFPLGNNLLTYNHYQTASVGSVHPQFKLYYTSGSVYSASGGSLYGTYAHYSTSSYGGLPTQSLQYSSSYNSLLFIGFPNQNNYQSEYELSYTNTPQAGYYSPVTEKVRIVNNTPNSNVLSPILRIEAPDTNRSRDTHFAEVSFSPQNEINKDIISQYGSLLDLDQYIGDPTYQGLNVYPDIVTINAQYYQKFISKYDYKDFINLVGQIDNTLFKMIGDFTPARTNLSTGVTIKSPILERNKISRHQPSMSLVQYTASVGHNTIKAGTSYPQFNEEMTFMTGDISGSYVDIHDNYEIRNYNPYLSYTQSFSTAIFKNSDFNVTNNDVYTNRLSTVSKKQDINNPNILQPVALQDSEYNHKRWSIPRYIGSKVSVQKLNKYTQGDTGSGTFPNINTYSGKFGYSLQGSVNNCNFLDKTTFSIKYLLDASGSTTTLTRANKNLFEVQNTFKSGDSITISLTNPLSPSNQFSIDGTSTIYLGGYSFKPIVYRDSNEPLSFTFTKPVQTYTESVGFKAVMDYSVNWHTINGADTNLSFALQYVPIRQPQPPSNAVQLIVNGQQVTDGILSKVYGSLSDFNSMYPTINTSYGTPQTWLYKGYDESYYQQTLYQPTGTDYLKGYYELSYFHLPNTSSAGGFISSGLNSYVTYDTNDQTGRLVFTAPETSDYYVSAYIPIQYTGNHPDGGNGTFKVIGVVEKYAGGSWGYAASTSLGDWNIPVAPSGDYSGLDNGAYGYPGNIYIWDHLNGNYITFNQKLDQTIHLQQGEKLRLRVFFLDLSLFFQGSNQINFTIPQGGYFQVIDSRGQTKQVVTQSIASGAPMFYISSSYTTGYNDTLIFDVTSSLLYNNSIFSPQYNTGALTSYITASYSPVEDIFTIQQGDLVRISPIENVLDPVYIVKSVLAPITVGGTVTRKLQATLDRAPVVSDTSSAFAIIRLMPDETSVIIESQKQLGVVSSAVLIPEYLDPAIENNVSNIIQPLTNNLLPQ